MKPLIPLALTLHMGITTVLPAQPTAGQIEEARTRGTTSKSCIVASKGKAFGKATGFDVSILGPLNRVECAAAAFAKKYQTLAAEDATSMGADTRLQIMADPITPIRWSDGSWHITPPATHVVLIPGKGQDAAAAVQPDSVTTVAAEWGNLAGGKFQSQGIRAWFDGAKLPDGEFTLVVITVEEEFRYRISAKDRQMIR